MSASQPVRRTQRLGAYAVAVDHRDGESLVLLTRISAAGYPPGAWTLPGGRVEHGEAPLTAVRRELAEETGLRASWLSLIDVHDVHVVEVGRGDAYEDYHGVHLLYAAVVETDRSPRVVEIDGTTDAVRWLAVERLRHDPPGPLLPMVEHVLRNLGRYDVSAGE